MVIPSGRICSVRRVEFAQDGIERAVIPLAQDFDPVTDEERSADSLPRLVTTLRTRTVIDDLGTTGSADVHQQRQANVVLLRHPHHDVSGTEQLSGPVLSGIAEDSSCPIEHVKSGATVDVRRRTRRTECKVLGTKGEDVDVGKVQQTACVRVGGAVRGPIYPTVHARQAGTHQELEGSLPGERGPRRDLRLARKMGEAGHATCAEKSDGVMCPGRRSGRPECVWGGELRSSALESRVHRHIPILGPQGSKPPLGNAPSVGKADN